jgi:hypothetical protein
LAVAACAADAGPGSAAGPVLTQAIATIRRVGPDSQGSAAAAKAWKDLSRADVNQVPEILAAMDGANALARNWLRSALDPVLDRARADNRPFPLVELGNLVRDTRHDPQARRLAYELVLEKDQRAAERFLPGMLNDPSPDLRRDAVAQVLDQAEKLWSDKKTSEALPLLEKAFAAARNREQVNRIAKRLREAGRPVDLPAHWGLVLDWKLIGPFPNKDNKGVDVVYPPEKEINLQGEYEGKAGKVRWKDHTTTSEAGVVDWNLALGKLAEVVAYARTEFTSPQERDAEIRLGCVTTFKLWVNGELVLVRSDAYTGPAMDSYKVPIHLKRGKNTFLLKSCRDEPPPQIPQWTFMLRVCDETGGAILSATRPAAAAPVKQPEPAPRNIR